MTDEQIFDRIEDLMQMSREDFYYIYPNLNISKEHEAAYDIQNFFIQTSYEMTDIYKSPFYEYTIYDKHIQKRVYSKNKGISGFLCNYKFRQTILLTNVKTSKSICIHDATSSDEQFLTFKTYSKILEAVRYILSE